MSYILDALKKAESDRQLGALPTLHGQQPGAEKQSASKILLIVIAALLALIVGLLLWRSFSDSTASPGMIVAASISPPAVPVAEVQPAVPTAISASTVPAPVVPAPVSTPAPTPAPVVISATAATVPTTETPPTVTSPSVKSTPSAPIVAVSVPATPVPVIPPAKVTVTPSTKAPAPDPVVKSPSELAEESLPLFSQLPEVIQREVPPVAIKGFMYSQNPADRILIVGSNFHHEGEELAAGVKLEKLLPNAAILNYKGFRYRVAY
jgi:general secretion pathway protein B